MYVTTSDFQIKDTFNKQISRTDSTVKKIFPPNSFTKEFILFKLRLKYPMISRVKLKIKNKAFKLGTSKQDGMYNVVSTCAYKNTEDQ